MSLEHLARLAAASGLVLTLPSASTLDALELLQECGGQATCLQLAEHTGQYPARRWHSPMAALVRRGLVERTGRRPVLYSLTPAGCMLLARR